MMPAIHIAGDEIRYWRRSKLVLTGLAAVLLLSLATIAFASFEVGAKRDALLRHQAQAEHLFQAQPDRHPHRMVHYGHYVFRTPSPLAVIDPGVDAVSGRAIFLEGHRQNTAAFADARAAAPLQGLGALSPAFVYQILAPLLLIALGHAAVAREREAGTLAQMMAQGVTGLSLLAGKSLALLAAIALLMAPLAAGTFLALAAGETAIAGFGLLAGYAVYLLVWGGLVLAVSALVPQRAVVLGLLALLWLAITILAPRLAVDVASAAIPAPGKIETDLAMNRDMRDLSDGHDASDPAFEALRVSLLAEHGVDRLEDLPVNFRGLVAEAAETRLTEVLNQYAENRMAIEQAQSDMMMRLGWLSPTISLSAASRVLAGTDLRAHHRFLREAESLRFDFVQALNRLHASELAYADDINRSVDPEAEQRTRVSAEHWQTLEDFRFQPAPGRERAMEGAASLLPLLVWAILVGGMCLGGWRRLKP
jgi:ABC-2 type transport system permease protein